MFEKKKTENKKQQVVKTKNGRIMTLTKCAVRDRKELKLIKKQETSGLLRSLGRKTPLSKTPLVGPLLFKEYKINRIVNKFLLSGDILWPDTHLRQPEFTSKVCGPFTKDKKEIQKFKETGDSRYIY